MIQLFSLYCKERGIYNTHLTPASFKATFGFNSMQVNCHAAENLLRFFSSFPGPEGGGIDEKKGRDLCQHVMCSWVPRIFVALDDKSQLQKWSLF